MRNFLLGTAVAATVIAMSTGTALAAGSGYAPGGSSVGPGSAAGFTSVLSAKTLGPTGGTITGNSPMGTATVEVPGGAFTSPEQISLTSGNQSAIAADVPSGDTLLTAFGVNFAGALPKKPITLTITNTAIPSTAEVFKVTASGLTKMNARVSAGKVTISFQNDPDFVVVKTTAGNVPGATSPVTGVPIALDFGAGFGIALLGSVMIFMSRRRESQ
ncbi:hypothetical protein [Alicyclobacillus sp. ALC3]|uniref:hypothetical protein n=1 Tax=Alicyclobacillus sp. ALC3 TaxID=2796143 RepID=UPI002379D7EF|nr:hypothetical protein [Alicyclobacillus sp. ALC3]WDL96104.1 hypothetical protein JC200_17440 [Alicyclobacillus sp. ALC3]